MPAPARSSLLPGIMEQTTPPRVVFESRRVVMSARRRAAFRDVLDLLLLATVDALFMQWPHAHVPLLDREQSVVLLLIANIVCVAWMAWARSLPRWRARRVASTWCAAERNRFFTRPL